MQLVLPWIYEPFLLFPLRMRLGILWKLEGLLATIRSFSSAYSFSGACITGNYSEYGRHRHTTFSNHSPSNKSCDFVPHVQDGRVKPFGQKANVWTGVMHPSSQALKWAPWKALRQRNSSGISLIFLYWSHSINLDMRLRTAYTA